ncbi:MAG TPA: 3-hydroxybutyryl-CoA dehydrogenase [Mycobacteriales bacterium]|nr:3-hydroxybutyryl-CoA dehydrogenase [Mycobacteriales bacterium]
MDVNAVGVVGLGTMGAGITEVFARADITVVAVEAEDTLLTAGRGRVETSLRRAVDRGRLTPDALSATLDRFTFTTDREALAKADLVIEAVPERLDVKTGLFADLDRICRPETILATNTSSLPVTAIAAGTGRPARVVGMHFFNPAPVMQLVEVVTTVLADGDVVSSVSGLAQRCGKTPVVVGDRAGFIANALLLPYLNHAARLVETGAGAVDAIDTAVVAATGLPMGPLSLMDLIGLDVCVPILDVLWEEFRDRRYAVSPLLRRLALAGHLGRKSGRGWYRYDGEQPLPAVPSAGRGDFDPQALIGAHVADGRRMVAEHYADAEAVDTAMRLGCGYPRGLFALDPEAATA